MTMENQYWLRWEFVVNLLKQLPAHVFWKNKESVYLGCSDAFAKSVGLSSVEEVVGKTDYDFPIEKERSDAFRRDDHEVMMTRRPKLNIEEEQIFLDGRKIFILTSKIPLINSKDKVMGILGVYYDITEMKKTQDEIVRLTLENEAQKQFMKAQEKFTVLANQVVHDIRSPLASLLMIVKSCTEIPETDRIALREAAMSIGDIANNLLSHYGKKDIDDHSEAERSQPMLVSAMLLQILTDKKYQYKDLPVKFTHDFDPHSHFAFIKMQSSAFKRMISNLMNNAVDAFDGRIGKVELKLTADNEWVKLIVQDNGKGMSSELIDKIRHNIAVTSGKEIGHGIGLTQVRQTLERNQGELAIESSLGKGTKIILTFPRIKAPLWVAEEILIGKSDIIVILDDDTSIHGAWDTRFDSVLKAAPEIRLVHFQIGAEALSFIESLTASERQRVFLLTDYELLKQELNGLHVVAKAKIQRSILVTSHFINPLVQEQAAKNRTKILAKHLASEISIRVSDTVVASTEDVEFKEVDTVIVDDDKNFITTLILFAFRDQKVDQYNDPELFLQNILKYSKNTKFYLDNNFYTSGLRGLDIAKQLHDQGYERCYILSGENFEPQEVPDYVTVIRKDDIESIKFYSQQ